MVDSPECRGSREVLHFVLEAVERESGRPGHPEHVLAWLADRGGIATAELRSGLASWLAPLPARLRRWGRGRTSGWVCLRLGARRSTFDS